MTMVLGKSLTTIALVALLVPAVALAAMPLLGMTTYVVTGASMEPGMPRGSLALVVAASPREVVVGDVITFRLHGRTTTHRVVDIRPSPAGPAFVTKGDANAAADPEPKTFGGDVGLVKASVPLVGYVAVAVQAYWRLALALVAVLVLLGCATALIVRRARRTDASRPLVRAADPRMLASLLAMALAGTLSIELSAASFTATTANPDNTLGALVVQPPASQGPATSLANGAVALSWTATPTLPGAGHTLSYEVLRGEAGGPYTLVASTTELAYTDTPPVDGSYEYVVRARVASDGSFTSPNSDGRLALSDRLPPTMVVACGGVACVTGWYASAVSVTVSGSDAGTGMASVTRTVDGAGPVTTPGASVTFLVAGDSPGHTVAYAGADVAGNASATGTQTVRIDTVAPTAATALVSAQGANGAPVTVELGWTAGTDGLSGVAGYEVRWTNPLTGACPAASVAAYPNAASIGAVSAYRLTGLTNNAQYCAYLVTIDAAGNRSPNSAATGPTKAR